MQTLQGNSPEFPHRTSPHTLPGAEETRREGVSRSMRTGGGCTHGIDLVEGLPLFVLDSQSLGGLDCPLHVAGPNLQVSDGLVAHVRPQNAGKLTENPGQLSSTSKFKRRLSGFPYV